MAAGCCPGPQGWSVAAKAQVSPALAWSDVASCHVCKDSGVVLRASGSPGIPAQRLHSMCPAPWAQLPHRHLQSLLGVGGVGALQV